MQEKKIKQELLPFVENISLQTTTFPLFPTTYTLWRKVIFQKLSKQVSDNEQNQLKKDFFKVSEKDILPQYVKKVKEEMNGRSEGWKQAIQHDQNLKVVNTEEYEAIVVSYSESVHLQQSYIELFHDLVSIPYLPIFSEGKVYKINPRFEQSFYQTKNEGFINRTCNKLGKTVLSKGLNKLSQTVLQKSLIYGLAGAIGSFNPIMMAASYTISASMAKYEKDLQIKKIVEELQILKKDADENVAMMEQTYEKCICLLELMIEAEDQKHEKDGEDLGSLREKFKKELSNVLIEDWLEIKVKKEGDWEVVLFKEADSFVNLEAEESLLAQQSQKSADLEPQSLD